MATNNDYTSARTRNLHDPQTISKLRKKRLREMTAEKFLQESTSDEEEEDGAHTLRVLRNNNNIQRHARTVHKRENSTSSQEESSGSKEEDVRVEEYVEQQLPRKSLPAMSVIYKQRTPAKVIDLTFDEKQQQMSRDFRLQASSSVALPVAPENTQIYAHRLFSLKA